MREILYSYNFHTCETSVRQQHLRTRKSVFANAGDEKEKAKKKEGVS